MSTIASGAPALPLPRSGHALDTARTGLVVLVFIDLLFMPRLLIAFGIPSALLLVILEIARARLDGERLVAWLLMLGGVIASVVYGTVSGLNPEPVESLKRALQLMSMLLFAFPRIDPVAVRAPLVRCLRAFYIYVFLSALLFYVSPDGYEAFIVRIYPEAADAIQDNLALFRFPYILQDPNSAGYLLALTLALYMWLEQGRRWKIVSSILALAALAATQSRGAYLAASIVYAPQLLRALRAREGLVALVLGIAAAGFLAHRYAEEVDLATNIFEARLEMEEDIGGGRADKYEYFLSRPNLLPIGTGYHLQRDGQLFRPHSDFIRVDLAYGVVVLLVLLWFVAPRHRRQVRLFLVFLIPFLINTIIDDYRLFPLYLLVLGMLGRAVPNGGARHPVGGNAR